MDSNMQVLFGLFVTNLKKIFDRRSFVLFLLLFAGKSVQLLPDHLRDRHAERGGVFEDD